MKTFPTALTQPSAVRRPAPAPLGQTLVALALGLLLFVVLGCLTPVIYSWRYDGVIYPGVTVHGIDLSGMSTEEATDRLNQQMVYPATGRIVFQWEEQTWFAAPRELGLFIDTPTTVQAAYNLGRTGSLFEKLSAQFDLWYSGKNLAPVLVLDERVALNYVKNIASGIDLPVIEASLSISGVEVVVKPGQVGRTTDVQAALTALRQHLPTLTDGIIRLGVTETQPVILDATAQAEVARRILSAPLVLTLGDAEAGDPGPWSFEPAALASMLSIERVEKPEGAAYEVRLNSAQLRSFLQNLAPTLIRYPVNARFIFNDDTRQLEVIEPAVIGRSLDIEPNLQLIQEKLAAGEHNIALDLDMHLPEVTNDATAEGLGITELVSLYSSYFYGSSADRIKNIQTASARFHGVLVPPGASFSMAEVLGDVSLDTGYAEALIIFGDRTIKGVGGGVCQVSTTLFRTVFFGGFPIVERYPHAYRVGYYEQTAGGGYNTNLAGLDATVFVPVVDFKFINDTPNWLLMETYINVQGRSLTWKFYSTSDGRTVDWQTTGPQNVVEPPDPLYEENPDLAQGQIVQVDWEAEGADITVNRTVWRNGQVLFTDQYYTHYQPWRAVYQYGPGTEIPKED
ncbi:MAG: VanW family protein [Anaerolineales bacterium]|nr:VanW family protein [Anaerolineales bacterium]